MWKHKGSQAGGYRGQDERVIDFLQPLAFAMSTRNDRLDALSLGAPRSVGTTSTSLERIIGERWDRHTARQTRGVSSSTMNAHTAPSFHRDISIFPIVSCLGEFLKILLCMRPYLDHCPGFDERRNLLPALAVFFQSFQKQSMFFLRPSARILAVRSHIRTSIRMRV